MVLTGLSDDNLEDSTLERLSASWPEDAVTVLLAHEPQYIENYAASGVDLAFCGHAHGGQIRLPLVGGCLPRDRAFCPNTQRAFISWERPKWWSAGASGAVCFPSEFGTARRSWRSR